MKPMVHNLFSVFDRKASAYGKPFCCPRSEIAIRGFGEAVQDRNLELSKWPEDFSLYHLGIFDDASGSFVALPNPVFLVNASDFVRSKPVEVLNGN